MSVARVPAVALVAVFVGLSVAGAASGKSIKEVHGFEPHFVLPPDANMVNIKDLGAVGDGKTDDTEAFKKAFLKDAPRLIYIPAGTYIVRTSLDYGIDSGKKKRTAVIGESASSTVIKLADGTPGFNDPKKPKAFIHTRPPKQQGEQNMHQYLYHLTIEIGRNNPGAIALNYHSNNTGAVKDVVIRASDPVGSPGHTGLACIDWEVGDAMARYLTVEGFQTGIALTKVGNYFTMEHVTVKNCQTGVQCGTVSIRDLTTENCASPVKAGGVLVLVDAVLKGRGDAAIAGDKGALLARNIKTQGFAKAIASVKGDAAGPNVDEYVSETKVLSNWPPAQGMGTTLNLPVEESPELQYPQSADEWAVMPKTGDISGAIQQAIDGGKKTVYIPGGGGMSISKTIRVRNAVERIMCVGVGMVTFKTGDQPVFRLEDGGSKVVILELIYGNYGSKSGTPVVQASPRTLVVRHGSMSYETAPEGAGGKLFMESMVNHVVCRKVHAWLRDMDTEAGGPDALNITNEGGVMWVLGQKTEDYATKLKTVNGFTELLGGTYRQNWDASDFKRTSMDLNSRPPLFEVINSHVSLTYSSWGPAIPFDPVVRETRGGEIRGLSRKEHGGAAALFVGYTQRPRP